MRAASRPRPRAPWERGFDLLNGEEDAVPSLLRAALAYVEDQTCRVLCNVFQEEWTSPFQNTAADFTCPAFKVKAFDWSIQGEQDWNFAWREVTLVWYKHAHRGLQVRPGDAEVTPAVINEMVEHIDSYLAYLSLTEDLTGLDVSGCLSERAPQYAQKRRTAMLEEFGNRNLIIPSFQERYAEKAANVVHARPTVENVAVDMLTMLCEGRCVNIDQVVSAAGDYVAGHLVDLDRRFAEEDAFAANLRRMKAPVDLADLKALIHHHLDILRHLPHGC